MEISRSLHLGIRFDLQFSFTPFFRGILGKLHAQVSTLERYFRGKYRPSPTFLSQVVSSLCVSYLRYGTLVWGRFMNAEDIELLLRAQTRLGALLLGTKRRLPKYITSYYVFGFDFALMLKAQYLKLLVSHPFMRKDTGFSRHGQPNPLKRTLWGVYNKYSEELNVVFPEERVKRRIAHFKEPRLFHTLRILIPEKDTATAYAISAFRLERVYFTDGSQLGPQGRSGGAFLRAANGDITHLVSFPVVFHSTVFEIELMAIHRAILLAIELKELSLTIFSDSQAALYALNAAFTTHSVVRDIWSTILRNDLKVSIFWTPSHSDIPLNDYVDSEALSAARGAPLPEQLYSPKVVDNILRESILEKLLSNWRVKNRHPIVRTKLTLSILRKFFPLHSTLLQVLTNVSSLRASVHNVNPGVSPFCSYCSSHIGIARFETVEHVIFVCPSFAEARSRFFRQVGFNPTISNEQRLRNIFSDRSQIKYFIRFRDDTGLFTRDRFFSLLNSQNNDP